MGQGVSVGQPRKIAPKSMFRLEIDGIQGDVRPVKAGPLKIQFSFIDTPEGGRRELAERTVTGQTYEPFAVERPLTEDRSFVEWVKLQKRGVQAPRNGAMYALDSEGKDYWKWTLYGIQIADFSDFDGDAKAKEDSMMEVINLTYLSRDERVRV